MLVALVHNIILLMLYNINGRFLSVGLSFILNKTSLNTLQKVSKNSIM